jgi:hypothetical protein
MAVTITESTITGESGVDETVVIAENTSNVEPISIEIDYSGYFARIATAMETIATNSTTVAQKITSIDTNIDALKEAGDPRSIGDGIRVTQPYGQLYLAYLWKEILQGGFLDGYTDSVTDDDVVDLLNKLENHDNEKLINQQVRLINDFILKIQAKFNAY